MIRPLLRAGAVVAAAALVWSGSPLGAATLSGNLADPISKANLDPTCRACDDFYQFATGGWVKHHPIPAAYPAWSPWNEMQERNEAQLRAAVEAAANDPKATGDEQRIGTYYRVCMDEALADKNGIEPLKPTLAKIDAITDTKSLLAQLPELQKLLTVSSATDYPRGPFFAVGPTADPKDSGVQDAFLIQSGITLPDREYYLQPKYQDQRNAEKTYATTIFTLLGDAPAAAASEGATAIDIETAIAKIEMSRTDLRDPQKTSGPANLMPISGIANVAPAIDWNAYFAAMNVPATATADVATLDYFKNLGTLLTTRNVADLKTYLRYEYVSSFANALSKPFVDASFAFNSTLTGQKEQRPRWKRCLASTEAAMAEPLGRVFVARAFPPEAKSRAQALVANLAGVLHDDITTLPWMSPATRTQAEAKLAAMRRKIGYPDQFRDYSGLTISTSSYAENAQRARAFETAFATSLVGKPTNRALWGMPPELINAQYDPTNNDITFPAAILAPPFFSKDADDAVNYGAIGAVIGHEMTHGFDDQGRQYDKNGNLKDWWTPADTAAFTKRSSCIVNEYDHLQVVPGQYQIGKLVQGEAIADLGGLTIAYKAFEKTPEFKSNKKIDGYTPAQRFFLAYALVWAENANPKVLSLQGQSNEHAIGRNRVLGTLANMPEFAQAFACTKKDKMVAAAPCRIW